MLCVRVDDNDFVVYMVLMNESDLCFLVFIIVVKFFFFLKELLERKSRFIVFFKYVKLIFG